MMFDDQFTPEEDALIQQIRNDLRPKLKPQVIDAIRAQVLAEMDTVFPASPQPKSPGSITPRIGTIIAITLIIAVVIIAIIIAVTSKQALPPFTPTVPPGVVTPTLSTVPVTNVTDTPVEPTLTPVAGSTAPLTLSPAATSADDTIIVIEGPVQQINVNIITIFNIEVQVDANDPILTQIHIGDYLHVEGHPVPHGNTIIIVAINVTIVNPVMINPAPGATGLPPNCKITPKGHIHCTKKLPK